MFDERKEEWSAKQSKNIPVWQTPKYLESRAKAVEIIESKKYGLSESDFWILKNETKSGKMQYTGLILSHNGCLKINDALEDKFKPECVSWDKEGYNGSLVFSYCSPDQGIFEVGEVNPSNCRIDYPYAMAFKRMMDRVVLKLSKLAFSGIYSEVEADEFRKQEEPKEEPVKEEKETDPLKFVCGICGEVITPWIVDGKTKMSVREIAQYSEERYGQRVCLDCGQKYYGKYGQDGK